MVSIDTLEGIIDNVLWFHYAVSDDVLYLRLNAARDVEAIGEETDDGMIVLRDPTSGAAIGTTIVGWWKRFGRGQQLPDSLRAIEQQIEPWARRVAA